MIDINKVYNDDCINLFGKIDDESIDLIVTDPPYKTTSRGNSGNSGGMLKKNINKKGKVFEHNDIDCEEYAKEFYRVLKKDSHCYVMTNHVNLIHMLNCFTDLRTYEERKNGVKKYGFKFVKSLIWDKGNKIMGQYYMSQFEYILFFRKEKGKKINNCGTSDIIYVPNKKTKDENGENIHDTEKPIELMEILINNSSEENDIVLDPFSGSGSTIIASILNGRRYIGIEKDEKYYNTILKRKERISQQLKLF